MKDNIDNIGDYLGQCLNMFFWDYVSYKNTPSTRATKIFKNNAEYIYYDNLRQLDVVQTNEHSEMRQIVRAIRRDKNYCQFMDIFGAMLAIAAHWQIIVQNTAAQM